MTLFFLAAAASMIATMRTKPFQMITFGGGRGRLHEPSELARFLDDEDSKSKKTVPNAKRLISPGEILRREMQPLALSATALARTLKVPASRITGILNGTRAISADTALRLARYFGTTPEFWLKSQLAIDLWRAQREVGKAIRREVRPRAA